MRWGNIPFHSSRAASHVWHASYVQPASGHSLGTIAAFRALLIYLGWARSIWEHPQKPTDGETKTFQYSDIREGKKSFKFSHNGSAVLTKGREENRESFPLSPPFLFLPSVCLDLLSPLFTWDSSSNKLPSLPLVLDLELKLGTAWLVGKGGWVGLGWQNGCWTEQIAPLQSVFYLVAPLFDSSLSRSFIAVAVVSLRYSSWALWEMSSNLVCDSEGRGRWMFCWRRLSCIFSLILLVSSSAKGPEWNLMSSLMNYTTLTSSHYLASPGQTVSSPNDTFTRAARLTAVKSNAICTTALFVSNPTDTGRAPPVLPCQ